MKINEALEKSIGMKRKKLINLKDFNYNLFFFRLNIFK